MASGVPVWEPWILYVLKGVEETAGWTQRKIEAMPGGSQV